VVEDLRRERVSPGRGAEGFSEKFQICLPYRGLFVWHVGDEDVVGDPTQVVFVRGGEAYQMSGPIPNGYAELIVTPDLELLSEMAHINGTSLSQHPLFTRRSWRADTHFQSFRTRFLHWARSVASEPHSLEAEEAVLALVRYALQQIERREQPNGTSTARLIRRTKEFLETNLSSRVLLTDIARAVGASPAYLTDLFSRVEGVSLHQYLLQLRLARALLDLPHTDDLTVLAFDLGFSSHSHFSFAFRRAFGCTPSEFRETTRQATLPTRPLPQLIQSTWASSYPATLA
jgi:AraC-like DNA-binding protein